MQWSLEVAFCIRNRCRHIIYFTSESSAPVSFPLVKTCDRLFMSNSGKPNTVSNFLAYQNSSVEQWCRLSDVTSGEQLMYVNIRNSQIVRLAIRKSACIFATIHLHKYFSMNKILCSLRRQRVPWRRSSLLKSQKWRSWTAIRVCWRPCWSVSLPRSERIHLKCLR